MPIRQKYSLKPLLQDHCAVQFPENWTNKQWASSPTSHWGASKINENLFLGDLGSSNNEAMIREHDIGAVVRIIKAPPHHLQQFEGIRYLHHEINDAAEEDIGRACAAAIPFIRQAHEDGLKVLVHCHAGISRSATVVMAYLMELDQKLMFGDVMDQVTKARPKVDPNFGFCQFLKDLRTLPESPKGCSAIDFDHECDFGRKCDYDHDRYAQYPPIPG